MNVSSSRRAIVLPPAPAPRPPAGGPAPPALKPDPDRNCPRCHTVLTDPHGIGLCPRCGYCRSLHVEGVAVLAAAKRTRRWAPTLRGLRHALHVAPAALLVVFVSFLAVVPLAILADQRFPPGSRARALWSAGNLVCGTLLILSGQAWAVTLLKRMNERVSWGDLLSPLHLWGLTLRRLPTTAWSVGLGGSGALAMLSAVVWVGGLSYWFSLTPSDDDGPAGRKAAARRKDPRDETELARVSRTLGLGTARTEPRPARAPEAPVAAGDSPLFRGRSPVSTSPPDPRPTEKCVIVGFVPSSGGREAGLVLARLREGELVFAGVVRKGIGQKNDLIDRLSKLGRARPLMDGLNLNAVWVRPELFCEVHQSGANDKGELVDPNLKGLLED